MRDYTYTTVLCVCGRQVARVPRDPGRRRCGCGARLYWANAGDEMQPFVELDKCPRAWNRRRPRILAAA